MTLSARNTGTVLLHIGFGFGQCCVEPTVGLGGPCGSLSTWDIL